MAWHHAGLGPRLEVRGTGRAVREATRHALVGSKGGCPPAMRLSARTAVSRVVLGIFGVGSGLEAARFRPGIEVGHGVHDTATELAELRATTNDALFLQRAR